MTGAGFFDQFGMQPVDSAGFDATLAAAGDALVGVYFWGTHCFNCEQFKKAATLEQEAFRGLDVHWLQADTYADRPLGLRFALHGVPTFYFFHRSRKLGRITSWPGWPAFEKAVRDLQVRIKAVHETP
jgi:thioredoxin-related protein